MNESIRSKQWFSHLYQEIESHPKAVKVTVRVDDLKLALEKLHLDDEKSHLNTESVNHLTVEKARGITQREGWKITGYTLTHAPNGKKCIVDISAVRWLELSEFWDMMHPAINEDTLHVHRFNPTKDVMLSETNGSYVLFSEYTKLSTKYERLKFKHEAFVTLQPEKKTCAKAGHAYVIMKGDDHPCPHCMKHDLEVMHEHLDIRQQELPFK